MPPETQSPEPDFLATPANRDKPILIAALVVALMVGCTGTAAMKLPGAGGGGGAGGIGGSGGGAGASPCGPVSSVPCAIAGGPNCDSAAQFRVCVDGVWRCPPGTIELSDCFAGAGCAGPNPHGCAFPSEFATCPGNPAECVNGKWQCSGGEVCMPARDSGSDASDGGDTGGGD